MIYVLTVGHKIEDYARWLAAYEGAKGRGKEAGQGPYRVFRIHDDPNNLVLLVEWESIEKFKAFIESDRLQQAMRQVGVLEFGTPHFLVKVDEGTLD